MNQRLGAAFAYIAAAESTLLEAVSWLVGIPSVAGDEAALAAAAAATQTLCADAGLRAELWPGSGPAAAVFAEAEAPAGAPTVLFYGHYDVQPADPLGAWESPPFAPTVRGGDLFGRGAGDNKGQFVPHLFGVAALTATGGCPVGVKLLIEGEEESGSPSLAEVVERHRRQLACDLAITADGPHHADGSPLLVFGVRGLVCLEVGARGAPGDLHSGAHGGVAPAPARELAQALASLWDEDGRVTVAGFYDAVAAPSAADEAAAAALPAPAGSTAGHWQRLMFAPNLNIAGIASGYTGPGVKTVIPHRARARLDIRLVAAQDPDEIIDQVRRHLGAFDVEIEVLARVPPSRTPLDNVFTESIAAAVKEAWQRQPYRQPSLGGTTPDYVFTKILGVPSFLVPYAPADMRHHAPNERMPVSAMVRGARTTAAICATLARWQR